MKPEEFLKGGSFKVQTANDFVGSGGFKVLDQSATPEVKKSLLQKAQDILTAVFPGEKVGEAIGTLAGYVISPNKEQYDLSAPTPLQTVGDVAQGAATVAGAKLPVASSLLGKAGQFGALGATSAGGEALSEGKAGGEIATEAVKGGAIGAGAGLAVGLAGKGFKALSNFLGKTGEKIQTSVIKPSLADVKDGFSIKTVNKYNLGGSLKQTFEKTDARLDTLSKELNTKRLSFPFGREYRYSP